MNLTRRHLRLQSVIGSFPVHEEIEATRRAHARLLGIETSGVLASSWGLCPLPIPPLGGVKPGDNLPSRINPAWAWHPVFWLTSAYRTPRPDDDEDSYLLRLLLVLSDAGLVVEEPQGSSVVILDPFERGQLHSVDSSRLQRWRDGLPDDELRGFSINPPHPGEVDRLVREVESDVRDAFDELLESKIDTDEQAADAARTFFASLDPYPLVRGSDPVLMASEVETVMTAGEQHLAALVSWQIACSGQARDDPDAASAAIKTTRRSASLRSEQRAELLEALYTSRGSRDAERALRNVLRGQLLTLCEEATRLKGVIAAFDNTAAAVPESRTEHQATVARSQATCVHRQLRRWMAKPFPPGNDFPLEHTFDEKHRNGNETPDVSQSQGLQATHEEPQGANTS